MGNFDALPPGAGGVNPAPVCRGRGGRSSRRPKKSVPCRSPHSGVRSELTTSPPVMPGDFAGMSRKLSALRFGASASVLTRQ